MHTIFVTGKVLVWLFLQMHSITL